MCVLACMLVSVCTFLSAFCYVCTHCVCVCARAYLLVCCCVCTHCLCVPVSVLSCLYSLCVRALILVSVLLCLYPLCVCACMHTLFFLSHYVPCVEASTAFQCIMLHVERNTYVCIYFVHIATTILCVYIMVGIGVFYELLFKLLHSLCFHVHMLICVC